MLSSANVAIPVNASSPVQNLLVYHAADFRAALPVLVAGVDVPLEVQHFVVSPMLCRHLGQVGQGLAGVAELQPAGG